MLLVVDANILFSALIKDSETAKLFLSNKLELIAPEFLLKEFEKYKSVILSKTHRSEQEFSNILLIFKNRISLISKSEIKPFLKQADSICPDPKDIQYLATAIKFNCPVWSNDPHFQEQSVKEAIKVFKTHELKRFLEG